MKKLFVIGLLALSMVGCGNKEVKVGELRFSHTTYTNEVYVVINEQGDEKYLLDIYVDDCINTYKERGTYGKLVPQGETL